MDVFCFDKTGTLTENQLGFAGALPTNEGETGSLVADLSSHANDDPLAVGVATCHSLALINGQLTGNSTDLCVFESLNWVNCLFMKKKIGFPFRIKLICFSNDKQLDHGYKMLLENGQTSMPVLSVARPKDGAEGQHDVAVLRLFPFDPARQSTAVVVKRSYSTSCEIYVKGAVEKVLKLCQSSSSKRNKKNTFSLKLVSENLNVLVLGNIFKGV